MAKYAYTKTLKKAVPTVKTDTGIVKSWDLEVLYTSDDNGWSRAYPVREEVEHLNKKPETFTKEELIALSRLPDAVWDAHWESMNLPPTEERVADFNLNNLK